MSLMFDVALLNGEDGPRGMPSHETFSVSPQGALGIFSSPKVVAKSRKCYEGADLQP